MQILATIGATISNARRRRSLTQFELAERVGISSNYLSQIERGRKEPSLSVLARLRANLSLRWTELFEEAETGSLPCDPISPEDAASEREAIRDKIDAYLDQLGLEELLPALEFIRIAARAAHVGQKRFERETRFQTPS